MTDNSVIIGSAVFVIGAGATAMKMILGWYLEEKKRADSEREMRIGEQVVGLREAVKSVKGDVVLLGRKILDTDKRIDKNTQIQEKLERENRNLFALMNKVFGFMLSPSGDKSEVVELKPGVYLVKRKNGPGGIFD